MASHEFIIEPLRENFTEHPGAGVIRVRDPRGGSFALSFATDPARGGRITLRIGTHALCTRQLYALAALLENQELRLRSRSPGSADC